MKLQVQSYNNGGVAYNAEAEETMFRTYSIEHVFNEPAKAIIKLADTDGSMMRKYNGDANDVYLGVGKITIEDPDATDIFFGRIMKVTANGADKTVTLECLDWLDQLDEEQITYDMREKLSGDIRQGTAGADIDHAIAAYRAPSYNNAVPEHFFSDDGMAWVNDVYNGMYLIFTAGMAGTREWNTGPYGGAISAAAGAGDFQVEDYDELWANAIGGQTCWDNDESWTQDIYFRVYLGHNTPSDFYVHDSISAAKFIVTHSFSDDSGEDSLCEVQIYDATGAAWRTVGEIKPYDNARGSIETLEIFTINDTYLDDCVDANGLAKIRFNVTRGAGTTYLYISYAKFYVTTETTGYSSAISIIDGGTNWLEVGTDLATPAQRIWEGCPYCVAQPQYKHIDSAEGGTLITNGDGIVTLTCAATIEHTSGISTRQYKEKTRLSILQDLARQDKASFWVTLGGTTVTYKKTFGADTQQLTDGKVLSWQSLYDYNQLTNQYDVYGARIGDYEIYQSQANAASILKYKATRTKVLRNVGLVSDADAKEIGTTLAARDAELSQMVACTITGNTATAAHDTTIRLGEIVEITTSYLWPVGDGPKDYIVTRFAYDSKEHKTYLTLHPKTSIGLQEIDSPRTQGENVRQSMKATESDKYVADPISHEVA